MRIHTMRIIAKKLNSTVLPYSRDHSARCPEHFLDLLFRDFCWTRQIRREDRHAPVLEYEADFPMRRIQRIFFPSCMPWFP
ncbi:MAG: hypothetical protein RIR37_10 [Verrucomicrobiota bacterium]